MKFLIGHPEHKFTGDPLVLIDSLHDLLHCGVRYSRHQRVGRRWAGDHEESKPLTITLEVTDTRLGVEVVRQAILCELARLGHSDVPVQLDT